ncbi:MAG: hypothetical protein KJ571_19015 [Bacteroidetes bacterium]|nr:hypothetical protein [Bacteroidota bacterium]
MEYKPIACGLYDELELLALKNVKVLIKFIDEHGKIIKCNSVISELFSENKVEYIKLTEGQVIRLDNLVDVNGKQFGSSCKD